MLCLVVVVFVVVVAVVIVVLIVFVVVIYLHFSCCITLFERFVNKNVQTQNTNGYSLHDLL